MVYRNPFVSVCCSLVPGLGQFYNGEMARGFVFFLGTYASVVAFMLGTLGLFGYGWWSDLWIGLLILGAVVWISSVVDAYFRATKINCGALPTTPPTWIGIFLFILIVILAIVVGIAVIAFVGITALGEGLAFLFSHLVLPLLT